VNHRLLYAQIKVGVICRHQRATQQTAARRWAQDCNVTRHSLTARKRRQTAIWGCDDPTGEY